MNKKLDIYFFGDNGSYDEFNPGYVCSKEFDCIIESLKRINAIDIIENKYKLNFPVFLEEDMPLLDKYFEDIGEVIGNKIIEIKEQIYEKISKLSNYSSFPMVQLLIFSKRKIFFHPLKFSQEIEII